jgi:hypothetical protein
MYTITLSFSRKKTRNEVHYKFTVAIATSTVISQEDACILY